MKETSNEEDSSSLTSTKGNENFASDFAYAVTMIRRFLTVLGIWRNDDIGKFSWRMILANVCVMIYYFGIAMRTIPMVAFIVIDAKGTYPTLNVISRTLFSFIAGAKYIFLHYHEREIADCVKHMRTDWMRIRSSDSREIMLDYARHGHRVTKIFAAFTFSAAIWFAILPFVFTKSPPDVSNENDTTIMIVTRPRSHAVPSNFGTSMAAKSPLYELIYAIQLIATFMLHSIQVSAVSVAVVIVMHACGQLNILMNMIGQLSEENDDTTARENFNGKLSDVVKHHVRALRFISTGERMLREICLIDLGGCTVELCFLAYFSLVEFRAETKNFVGIIVYMTLFATFTFNIFMFCYIGELLMEECEKIGHVAYVTDWHRLSGKQPLCLCLIISMSQSPAILTAGGAIPLSFACFANVMKTSMGYLNMLRTITE